MNNRKLLLLSNSTLSGQKWFEWAESYLQEFISDCNKMVFIPYAGIGIGFDKYTQMAKDHFSKYGVDVIGVHSKNNKIKALENADIIAVGGGNTFYLYHEMHKYGLIESVRNVCLNGTKYVGWSAGSNLACPGLFTSNDMPIVEPASFKGLNLIPYQINPHYTEKTLEGHGGESREQRLKEYIIANPDLPVLGLPEGTLVQVDGTKSYLIGFESKLITSDKTEIISEGEITNTVLL